MTAGFDKDKDLLRLIELPANRTFWPGFWITSWLSTIFAGGVFGIVVSVPNDAGEIAAGFIIGTMISAIYAVPVVATFSALTRTLWLSRFAVAMAAKSGACTGVLATLMVGNSVGFEKGQMMLAACIGGAVTGLGTFVYWRRFRLPIDSTPPGRDSWQFSLQDLFVRFTIVSVLVALWVMAVRVFLD